MFCLCSAMLPLERDVVMRNGWRRRKTTRWMSVRVARLERWWTPAPKFGHTEEAPPVVLFARHDDRFIVLEILHELEK